MTGEGPLQSPFESAADARHPPAADDVAKPTKMSSDDSSGGGSAKGEPAHTDPAEEDSETVWQSPMFRRAPFIIVQEFCERLAYYGIATNIITYLTGVLNMSNSSASAAVNAWSGTCYITPLLGAFLADAYLGRYWVILVFSVFYMVGLSGLSASAGISSLHPAPGEDATSSQLAFFWAFMYLIALGTGGIKPCVSTFGADQFDESRPSHRRLIPRFFNWFYFAINVGAMLSATVVVNVQSHDWFAGFLIPAVAFAVAILVFVSGSRLYRRMPPAGSPFSRITRVLVGAVTHRKAKIPDDDAALHEAEGPMSVVPGQAKLPRTPGCKCLERAAVPIKPAGAPDRWLVTLTEVEEAKAVARLLPIMATLIVYNAVYAQMTTLFILQGEGMDTSLGSLNVAPATVSVLDSISVMIWIALYDFLIAPFFARRGRPISLTLRIGIGYVIAALAMIAAGVVEVIRLGVVDRHGLQDVDPTAEGAPVVPMSVWWQIPQYFLVGCSEVFAMVGSLELFYSQAPDAMRSTCSALQLVATALGSYLASLLVIIVQAISDGTWVASNVNDGHMDYFFFMMSVLMVLTLFVYVFVAKRFRYKQVVHTTIDPEALALAPDTRGAVSFSAGVIRKMSADLGQGMFRQDSLELHAAMSSGRLSAKHSARATAFLGAASAQIQLQPLAEACEAGVAPGAPDTKTLAGSGSLK